MLFRRQPESRHDDLVTVQLSRRELSDLNVGELGARVAAAARGRTVLEFEPAPAYTVQDVLHGEITWEQLAAEHCAAS